MMTIPEKHCSGWLCVEEKFLKENHKTMTPLQMAEKLGRTAVSITHRTCLLGLPVMRQKRRPWTPAEKQIVVSLFNAGMSDEEIARLLGRSFGSVNNRRKAMNLKRERNWENSNIPWSSSDDKKLLELWPDEQACVRTFKRSPLACYQRWLKLKREQDDAA